MISAVGILLVFLTQGTAGLASGNKYNTFIHGSRDKKQVAITFDDGPHPAYTPKLLAILAHYNVKATFFLVGEKAEQAPNLVRAQAAAGHNIGNHTYHHVNLQKIPDADVAVEIQACGAVLKGILGQNIHLFRPPGGGYDKQVAQTAEALGYTTVFWSANTGDYKNPGGKAIEIRILRRIDNGGIILLHDGVRQTVEVLPQIIQYLQNKGYELVTIDEMMGRKQWGRPALNGANIAPKPVSIKLPPAPPQGNKVVKIKLTDKKPVVFNRPPR
jgi:polysaccharide deacetylase family sporulation protein PdaB